MGWAEGAVFVFEEWKAEQFRSAEDKPTDMWQGETRKRMRRPRRLIDLQVTPKIRPWFPQ